MKNSLVFKNRTLNVICYLALLIAVCSPIIVESAVAAPRVELRGSVGFRLPQGAISISVGSQRYRYHRGTYYRKSKNGFVVTRAPRGAVVRELPHGYSRVIISGSVYYRYGGAYYRKEPRGYVVVDAPVVVHEEAPATSSPDDPIGGYQSVWVGDKELLFRDGQFFRNTSEGLVWVVAPIGAIAGELPVDAISVWYEEIEYFDSDGVVFRKTPDGYKVVEQPWQEAE